MMTSFITKKESDTSAILDPPFEIVLKNSILLKTRRNRGIFHTKLDLSIKGCIGSKNWNNKGVICRLTNF